MAHVITINRPDVVALIEEAAARVTGGNKTAAVALAVRRLLDGESRAGSLFGAHPRIGPRRRGRRPHRSGSRCSPRRRDGAVSEGLLLDTHIMLWLDSGAEAPRRATRALIEDCWCGGGTSCVSTITAGRLPCWPRSNRTCVPEAGKVGSRTTAVGPPPSLATPRRDGEDSGGTPLVRSWARALHGWRRGRAGAKKGE